MTFFRFLLKGSYILFRLPFLSGHFCHLSVPLSVSWTTRRASQERRLLSSVLACVPVPLSLKRAHQRREVSYKPKVTQKCEKAHNVLLKGQEELESGLSFP